MSEPHAPSALDPDVHRADVHRSAGGLRVTVDLNLCQAYAQCCYAAPDHFVLKGREALHYDPAPSATAHGAIERARIACPVQAIRVEDAGVSNA